MAKKEKKDTKEDKEEVYDLNEAIDNLETSYHMKKGFEYYLNHNTITIKDNASLNKEFTKFTKGV